MASGVVIWSMDHNPVVCYSVIYLEENPLVTTRLPETTKSESVPECASRTCSDLRLTGSRKVTLATERKRHKIGENLVTKLRKIWLSSYLNYLAICITTANVSRRPFHYNCTRVHFDLMQTIYVSTRKYLGLPVEFAPQVAQKLH
jgi:hypothetical protein